MSLPLVLPVSIDLVADGVRTAGVTPAELSEAIFATPGVSVLNVSDNVGPVRSAYAFSADGQYAGMTEVALESGRTSRVITIQLSPNGPTITIHLPEAD